MTFRSRNLLQASLGLAVLSGLLMFFSFGVRRTREDELRAHQASQRIFDFNSDQIQQVTVAVGTEKTACQKVGREKHHATAWMLTAPVQTEGDNQVISNLIKTLEQLQVQTRISASQAEALPVYGLDPPRGQITLTTEIGTQISLKLGIVSSFNQDLYVQREGDSDVFLVLGNSGPNLFKNSLDLRRKQLLDIEPEEVGQVMLGQGKDSVLLERRQSQWEIRSPISDRADAAEIKALLMALSQLRGIAFPEPKNPDLKTYGLDPPVLTVTLPATDPSQQQVVDFGVGMNEHLRGKWFARRREPEGPLAEIAPKMLPAIQKSVFELRAKAPVEFDASSVYQIKLASDKDLIVLERQVVDRPLRQSPPEAPSEAWSLISPVAVGAKSERVRALLAQLGGLRATKLIGNKDHLPRETYGLDKPVRTIRLLDEMGREIGVLQVGKTTREGTFLEGSARPYICLVDSKALDQIPQSVRELSE